MAVIALDLGGTKLAAALLNNNDDILFKTKSSLDKRRGNEVGQFISTTVNEILNKAETINEVVVAIGICIPGISHARTGKVWAPNIPGWDDYPLLEGLKRSVNDEKIKIRIDSDRACYILGEVWKGNARDCRDAIFLSVGTGIGAGILVNNEVLRGSNDIAGAIGWMGLDRPFQEKYIHCGDFEYNASGEGIAKVAKEKTRKTMSAKEVFDAYENGDEDVKIVIANAIECWGMAVANLVSLFNPEKIVFGGGVFGPALKYLDDIYAEAKKWAQPISMQQVKLEGSALGNDAGLYGAAWLAMKD